MFLTEHESGREKSRDEVFGRLLRNLRDDRSQSEAADQLESERQDVVALEW